MVLFLVLLPMLVLVMLPVLMPLLVLVLLQAPVVAVVLVLVLVTRKLKRSWRKWSFLVVVMNVWQVTPIERGQRGVRETMRR